MGAAHGSAPFGAGKGTAICFLRNAGNAFETGAIRKYQNTLDDGGKGPEGRRVLKFGSVR